MYDWSDKKILIVEDNNINYLLLQHMLQITGILIDLAKNSNCFFKFISMNNYDLILMDINLNEKISGVDLIKFMKSNNINVPVIIQTAYDEELIHSISDIQHSDIISKPLNRDILFNKININFNIK